MNAIGRILFGIVALAIVFFIASLARAQTVPKLIVATGPDGGTYNQMFMEVAQVCGAAIDLEGNATNGSNTNVDMLSGNKVNGAIVQSDVLWLRAKTEKLDHVKTLFTLHPEEVHVIALSESKAKSGGVMGIGAKTIEFFDLASLAGHRVAASGGSLTTARVLKLMSDVPFEIIEAASTDDALKRLSAGEVEAVVAVGGQPMKFIESLSRTFKLLPISETQREKLKAIYNPASLHYSNLRAEGVPTVSVGALFVTREYKTARMQTALGALRRCVAENIDEFKETIGFHAKWQSVDPDDRGKLPYYEIKQ